MESQSLKHKLIATKRKLNQSSREIQDLIDELDKETKGRHNKSGNSKDYVSSSGKTHFYREDKRQKHVNNN
jgi:hypothetical protein